MHQAFKKNDGLTTIKIIGSFSAKIHFKLKNDILLCTCTHITTLHKSHTTTLLLSESIATLTLATVLKFHHDSVFKVGNNGYITLSLLLIWQ